eukprot:scaffold256795_cov17-Tisochrysis_lutea.AAC.1
MLAEWQVICKTDMYQVCQLSPTVLDMDHFANSNNTQAKWVNMYHQLRRFKAVHGHTNVPPGYRNSAEPGWEILA